MDFTFENLESDNTAFPLHFTAMNLVLDRESYNSNMDHQQSKNDETLDWNGPLDVLGPTFSGVMSRLYLL